MGIWSQTIAAIRPLVVFVAVAPLAVAETSDGESYFMQARVTRVHFDRTIDFWVTSAHALPRSETASGIDLSQLPKVIATLELKGTDLSSRVPEPGLRGTRIALRGRCEDLARAVRVPVLQVRLGPGESWRQASLLPENRAGREAFQRVAAAVCGSDAPDDATSLESTDGPE
jgi:hypothetical protein